MMSNRRSFHSPGAAANWCAITVVLLTAMSGAAAAQGPPTRLKLSGSPSMTAGGVLRCAVNDEVQFAVEALDADLQRTSLEPYAPQAMSSDEKVTVGKLRPNGAIMEVLCVGDGEGWITVEANGVKAELPVLVGTARSHAAPVKKADTVATSTSPAPTPSQVFAGHSRDLQTAVAPAPAGVTAQGMASTFAPATGFAGIAGPKYAQLTWKAAAGAYGYIVRRYDPGTQRRSAVRAPGGDTIITQSTVVDTAVSPNVTYGYFLVTLYGSNRMSLLAVADTNGVAVTPKDPNAPLALDPSFTRDPMVVQYVVRGGSVTFSWNWRYGAVGYRVTIRDGGTWWQLGRDGHRLLYSQIGTPYIDDSFVGPFGGSTFTWLPVSSEILVCVSADSPIDPTTKSRVESPPALVRLSNESDKWEAASTQYDFCIGPPAGYVTRP